MEIYNNFMAEAKEIKVTVLLEHYEGEENWTATVPLIKNCLAEGSTPEEASQAVMPEIEYFVDCQPELLERLERQPEFRLATVDFVVEDQTTPDE